MNTATAERVSFHTREQIDIQKGALKGIFASVIADEKITDKRTLQLVDFYRGCQLPEDDIALIRDEAFRRAAHSEIVAQGSAPQDVRWLLNLAIKLGVSSSLMDWMEEEVSTLTILNHIENCTFAQIPQIIPESILPNPGELALAEFPAFEVREVSQKRLPSDGSSSGGFKLTRGLPYRIGQQKSELLERSFSSETSDGFLVITDSNITFSGSEGFSANISGLIGTRIFADAIQFSTINDSFVRTIGFREPISVEYCAVILSKVLNK